MNYSLIAELECLTVSFVVCQQLNTLSLSDVSVFSTLSFEMLSEIEKNFFACVQMTRDDVKRKKERNPSIDQYISCEVQTKKLMFFTSMFSFE